MQIGKLILVAVIAFGMSPVTLANDSRNPATVRAFKRINPCPANGRKYGACPGWVMDHVKPLKCGGRDLIENIQWQTRADSLRKDRWEIRGDSKHPPCSGLPN